MRLLEIVSAAAALLGAGRYPLNLPFLPQFFEKTWRLTDDGRVQ
jgi:hypothetical protein